MYDEVDCQILKIFSLHANLFGRSNQSQELEARPFQVSQ